MLGNIGTVELLLIMLAILLVFGAKRIPEIAHGLGQGIREFKSALREISNEIQVEDRQMRRATDVRSGPARSAPEANVGNPRPAAEPNVRRPRTVAEPNTGNPQSETTSEDARAVHTHGVPEFAPYSAPGIRSSDDGAV